ncbi:SDR family NAD(P)-dependent oxidoreductase [Comamonas sp. Y33R10-2]|uniref:SDR family NAD(P)-dependent oxidoreductase n=1 Tax=Comamonas sp. Y33R10-2 TaxID=2853257 RepID=UPI001C5C95EF|nr:SDR family NAD(P)-dependent oxidoreductase [Comamonas sp. Y33R10-2]QXZ11077.1 SDR family NAD(P)-dependent oxidoreductase [Comamonas sp. Y33R10-2]
MNKHLTILTGGSRGMGLAMGQQLLAQGYHVLSIARNSSSALQSSASKPEQLLQWEQDLAQSAAAAQRLSAWLATLKSSGWASITLINNAGVIPQIAALSQVSAADMINALRVGLEAPMALTSAFLAATQSWSIPRKVLNISSGLGRRAMASQAAYCTTKAGMDQFSSCVALEEAAKPNGARIVSLAPGVIDTDMQVQLRSAAATDFPDVARFAGLHTNGQLTSTNDAAARVLAWLDRADFGEQVIADVRQP